jgi:hypothetical protein
MQGRLAWALALVALGAGALATNAEAQTGSRALYGAAAASFQLPGDVVAVRTTALAGAREQTRYKPGTSSTAWRACARTRVPCTGSTRAPATSARPTTP